MNAKDAIKVLATADENGVPNVAHVWSIMPVGQEQVAFAEMFIKKTKQNLEKNKKVAISVFKAPAISYQLKGTFVGFQTSGQIFDDISKMLGERNMKVISAGVVNVDEVFAGSPGAGSKKLA